MGAEIFRNGYALSVQFTSLHDNSNCVLTNIYGPCDSEGKRDFLNGLEMCKCQRMFVGLLWGISI